MKMTETKFDLPMRLTRAAALRTYAGSRGATGFLDVRFSACPTCDVRRIAETIKEAAAGARKVGTFAGPGVRYEVFARTDRLRPLRLLVGADADGTRTILAADRRPADRPPPRYLEDLELLELEVELKAMAARLQWEPAPLDAAAIDSKFAGRHHLIYIPLSATGVPLKVGETVQPISGRYPKDWIPRGKTGVGQTAHKYWVARVLVEDTRRGHRGEWIPAQKHQVQDVEYLVARRLSRGGATLPLHLIRMKGNTVLPLPADGAVTLGSVLPGTLAAAYPDKRPDPSVIPARLRNNIALAAGDRYEVPWPSIPIGV
jgi:hypothetical protein